MALLQMEVFAPAPTDCSTPGPSDFVLPDFELVPDLPPFKELQVWFMLMISLVPAIKEHETPVQLRLTSLVDSALWNCVAAFHPSYLDSVTGARPTAAVPAAQHHVTDARLICGVHATAALVSELIPHGSTGFLAGFPAKLLRLAESDMGLPSELSLDEEGACGWQDEACVQEFLACRGYSPQSVGKAVAQTVLGYARADGWNYNGGEYHGKQCTSNCRPYSDSTTYDPRAGTCATLDVHQGLNACWQPLLEDDKKGFFFRQEHVTPHIGAKAVPRTMSPAEISSKTVSRPAYNYTLEADLMLRRVANLSDAKKVQVEFFNDKISVAIAILQAIIMKYGPAASYERMVLFVMGYTASEHDAVIVAWKEKTRHSLLRPTSVLASGPRADDIVTTYAGPFKGVGQLARRDVFPFVRTMPHAEYPSGSGCLFQAAQEYSEAMIAWTYSDTTPLPISWPVAAGSSRIEPGATPAVDRVIQYASLEEMKVAGGESRLDSGVHFTASVPDSYALCAGIGGRASGWAQRLAGSAPPPAAGFPAPGQPRAAARPFGLAERLAQQGWAEKRLTPRVSGNCTAPDPAVFKLPVFDLLPDLPPVRPLQFWLTLLIACVPAVKQHETPIQIRLTSMLDTMVWNCIAAFHSTYLDAVTMARPVFAVPDARYHNDDARLACAAHAVAAGVVELFPHGVPEFLAGLPAKLLGMTEADMRLPAELSLSGGGACQWTDAQCVEGFVSCHGYNPRAVGKAVAQAVLARHLDDGFNSQGAEFHGRVCTGNCRPYSDSTSYSPGFGTCANITVHPGMNACWEPLLEDDDKGFFFRQEHVTPHIGVRAAPLTMTRAEVASKTLDPPPYDYSAEADLALTRLANLTDSKKAQVEFFNDKISVAIAVIMAVITKHGPAASYERMALFTLGFTATEHDAVIVAWKEKVRHNMVRVPTVLQRGPRADELVDTWAGPYQGTKQIARRDVHPFVRTMPHAEYPSGSGCLFQAVADYGPATLAFLFNDTSPLPVAWQVEAGSSRIEPGFSPSSNLTLMYSSLEEMKLAGGQSRLDSGVHFTLSVPHSYALCAGIGQKGSSWARRLQGVPDVTSPAAPAGGASAAGDPHMTNMLGQTFDLMQPGSHLLLHVPKGAASKDALLRVQADVRGEGAACSDMYILALNVSGKWAAQRAKALGSAQTAVQYVAEPEPSGARVAKQEAHWEAFGGVQLKVVRGQTGSGVRYLNLFARHLQKIGFHVGGLLGEDDHTAAATPGRFCRDVIGLGSVGEAAVGPRGSVANAGLP